MGNHNLVSASVAMLVAQIIMVASNFILVSLLGRFLDMERLGLWLIIASLIPVMGNLDFGLGQAFRNKLCSIVASGSSNDNKMDAQNLFYSVFWILMLISSIGIVIIPFVIQDISWVTIFNIHNAELKNNINSLLFIILISMFISLPFSLHSVALLAYQDIYLRCIFETVHVVLLLLLVYVLLFLKINFTSVAVSYYLVMTIFVCIRTVIFCKINGWFFSPPSLNREIVTVNSLMNKGLRFWFIGLASSVILSVGPVITGKVLGLSEAGEFSMVQKIVILLLSVQSTMLVPLWSAYTQAACKDDWQWISKTFYKSLGITIAFFLGTGIFLVLAHPIIFKVWIGKEITNIPLVLSQSIWIVLYGCYCCNTMLLNSLGYINQQSIIVTLSGLAIVPISLYLGNRYGMVGISLGYIIITLPLLITSTVTVNSILRNRSSIL